MECEIFVNTPISALRGQCKSVISRLLNATKVIPSPSGLPRDWRGLADIAGCNHSLHAGCADPTASVLAFWQRSQPTIAHLIDALKEIDRWDVIDDSLQLLESDAKDYAERLQVSRQPCIEDDNNDDSILTVDDIQCIESCGKPQYYDAFLLYDDSDEEFAMTILEKLEDDYKMKLCTKDRDLIGGLSFEHEAIMQLIRYRCGRLIVVISPSFLNSPANQFLLTFAQALGIEQRQRKIIPCVYSNFQLPLQLRYYFILNFGRATRQWNFWQQLSQSVRATNVRMITNGEVSRTIANREEFKSITHVKHSMAITIPETKTVKESEVYLHIKENELPEDIEKRFAYSIDKNVVIKEEETAYIQPLNEKESKMSSSSSIFTKILSSRSTIAKSLFKKKKKLAKVLAE
ncbi:myeloid differentiation primary response protein MyD88 [Halyomorpha halys]|uniref:myeloid differentiation primary response protein MyD88 n=1 Tax=Halyomorpha halys TaxID=286706 RepID=UPI0006D4D20E|nr:myeloid differentiation primary response protein MyD88 [Halyomorpha halys]